MSEKFAHLPQPKSLPASAGFPSVTSEEGLENRFAPLPRLVCSARVFAEGPNCTAIQVEMNVIDEAPDIIEVCEEFNQAVINRGPLAMGLLTGKYTVNSSLPLDDVRGEQAPEWMKYFKNGKPNPEWLNKLEAVREILTSGGRTLAQGAIAWLWGRSDKTIPISGFKTVAQVEDNAGAMRFGPLTAAQMQEIDTLLGR